MMNVCKLNKCLFLVSGMEDLVEFVNSKTGRKCFHYIVGGENVKIITRRQHLVDLQACGKLKSFDIEQINFSTKRKRSFSTLSFDGQSAVQLSSSCSQNPQVKQKPNAGEQQKPHAVDQQKPHAGDQQKPHAGDQQKPHAGDQQEPHAGDQQKQHVCSYPHNPQDGNPLTGDQHNPHNGDEQNPLVDESLAEAQIEDTVHSSYQPILASNFLQDPPFLKVNNQLSKKVKALDSLKTASTISDLKQVCVILDLFRSEQLPAPTAMDQDWKNKMVDVLTGDKRSDDDIYQLLSACKSIRAL
jgi:hypothetical protein